MDISIYCRKPSKIELILDELEANINAIVADCHKRLDALKKEWEPSPIAKPPKRPIPDTPREYALWLAATMQDATYQQRAMLANAQGMAHTQGLYGQAHMQTSPLGGFLWRGL